MKLLKTGDIQIRDPFVLKENRNYYLFGSTDRDIWKGPGTGFDAYVGHDLEYWEGPYPAFRPDAGFWGKDNFWAPEVYEYRGAWYMFATFRGENMMRGTAILKARHPLGPYEPWSEGAVTPKDRMSLDGTLFVDDDGQPWMVFCHEWVQIKDGAICAMKLSKDLKKPAGEPVELFRSTLAPWSVMVESKSNNVKGWVTDGPFLHRMNNRKLLMLWSCMGPSGYCIGYAVSRSGNILGPWKQANAPLFDRDGGHGMIFETYDGRLLLAIHTPNKTPHERAAFFPLRETDEGLELGTACAVCSLSP
ncbi:MAG: family 43 glycosylhydrolase [Clostridiaceae bacterium]|jgi:beta-xylosidase|nr:family 43 glycosylhydrolase [Clostridiaceae bacterium]